MAAVCLDTNLLNRGIAVSDEESFPPQLEQPRGQLKKSENNVERVCVCLCVCD
ncbi:hypothetical protein NQZ68_038100 [Dissostichus eleginoides]|nr:hypothetical protein NQZ68_038100 [Dissostichus eleginoides]